MGSMRKNINFIIPRNFRESFNKKDRFVRLSTNLIFNYYLSLYFRFGLKGRFLRWTRKRFSCWIYFLEPLWGPFFDNNFYFWLYVMYRNKSVNGVLNFFVRSNKFNSIYQDQYLSLEKLIGSKFGDSPRKQILDLYFFHPGIGFY